MFDRLNSIRKNLLFDIIVGLILLVLIIYNFYDRLHLDDFTATKKISIGLFFMLGFHALFLFVLAIINVVRKKNLKAVVFLLTSIVLFAGLYFIAIFLFISTLGGPPIDEGNRHNFQQSKLCTQLDTNKIKETINKFRKGIFPTTLDSFSIKTLSEEPILLPRKITKIECGCRKLDTTIVVFRIWDSNSNTFEMELMKENGQWIYKNFSYGYFD